MSTTKHYVLDHITKDVKRFESLFFLDTGPSKTYNTVMEEKCNITPIRSFMAVIETIYWFFETATSTNE